MTWKSVRSVVFVAFAAVAASGCEESPTSPTPETFTDNFSGTLAAGQSVDHQFTVQVEGPVTVVLVNAALETPPPEGGTTTIPPIGLGIGTWNGTSCTRAAINGAAVIGTVISGTALPGQFCVAVYDSGSVAANLTYSGQIIHP